MANQDGVRKLWFKLNAGGNVEQTKMSPDFIHSCEKYDQYKAMTEDLVAHLEACIQQNPAVLEQHGIECPPGENPAEKMAASLGIFHTYLTPERAGYIVQVGEQYKKMAAIQRDYQLRGRRALRHLRRFNLVEYKELMDERAKLNKTREWMDQVKHEVKMAKTTEQIEKKAVAYEEAVTNFDQQAGKVIALLDQLPTIKQNHLRDLSEYFEALTKFSESVKTSLPAI